MQENRAHPQDSSEKESTANDFAGRNVDETLSDGDDDEMPQLVDRSELHRRSRSSSQLDDFVAAYDSMEISIGFMLVVVKEAYRVERL